MREFQEDKADVIHKYTSEEARNCTLIRNTDSKSGSLLIILSIFLVKIYKELPKYVNIDGDDEEGSEGADVQFGDEEEEETRDLVVDIDDL